MSDKDFQTSAPNDPAQSLLTMDFAGLISFVRAMETDLGGHPVLSYYALLVAAHRSTVRRPRLCQHDRYLVFPAGEKLLGVEGGKFYTSFLGPSGEPFGIWNIDGRDVGVQPVGDTSSSPPISTKTSYQEVLDLRSESGVVDPYWLTSTLADRELVGARFRFRTGTLESIKIVDRDWSMCVEGDEECAKGPGQKFSQIVRYQHTGQFDRVRIVAEDSFGDRQSLTFGFGTQVTVTNLCPITNENKKVERDVLAFYELSSSPKPMHERKVPHLPPPVAPGKSACPPVQQGT